MKDPIDFHIRSLEQRIDDINDENDKLRQALRDCEITFKILINSPVDVGLIGLDIRDRIDQCHKALS